MLRDDLITIILLRAGQRQNDTVLRSQLEGEIQLIQGVLEGGVRCGQMDQGVFYPWFMYKENSALAVLALSETVALPTDFISEYDEGHGSALWYYNVADARVWVPLTKDGLDIIRARYTDNSDFPGYYSIVGSYIYIRPLATVPLVLRLAYYAQQTTLLTNIENNWLKYALDVVEGELTIKCGEITHEEAFVAKGQQLSKQARDRLYAAHVQREEAARQRQRGDD